MSIESPRSDLHGRHQALGTAAADGRALRKVREDGADAGPPPVLVLGDQHTVRVLVDARVGQGCPRRV
ncbi:hypothetical protein [Streptomyces sp. NPDC048392]|uniref:hypothetical protein n=1 Tax=Streptomyces sp. NPDC048392 TaxID=3365543 RepID=UPI00371A3D79